MIQNSDAKWTYHVAVQVRQPKQMFIDFAVRDLVELRVAFLVLPVEEIGAGAP
jgi:hypothetical protein